MKNNNFSLIIPVYNEEKNIKPLVKEIINSLDNKFKYEVIFINDDSKDDSEKILIEISNKYSFVKYINHQKNYGQSKAIYTGINAAINDTIITIDGDLQNNPYDILKLYNLYQSSVNVSLVGGLRTKRKDTYVKIISSKIANKVRSMILRDDCIDTGCSLKVFSKKIFLSLPFFDGIHRFLPALFKACGTKTIFVEVDHRHRINGISKYDTFGRLYRGVMDLFKVLKIIKLISKNHA